MYRKAHTHITLHKAIIELDYGGHQQDLYPDEAVKSKKACRARKRVLRRYTCSMHLTSVGSLSMMFRYSEGKHFV